MAVLYGFHNLEDAFPELVSDVGEGEVINAIQQANTFYNQQANETLSMLAFRTTEHVLGVRGPDTFEMQELDEWGRPVPVRRAGMAQAGLPLQRYGAAIAESYEARIKMTVQDVNDVLSGLQAADSRKLQRMALAALFDNDGWTYPDPKYGSITVKGLANGEADLLYFLKAGGSSTENHYSGQAGVISDTDDPFPVLHAELDEHSENTGPYVSFINTAEKAAVEALSGFYPAPDQNLTLGIANTQLNAVPALPGPGQTIGYHEAGIYVREWSSHPAGYVSAVAVNGPPPLAMREDDFAQLQGFGPVADREDWPYLERIFMRKAGFGVYSRISAAVRRIGNATYQTPAGYTAPVQ